MRFDTPYNQRTTPPHHAPAHRNDLPARGTPAGSRKWNSWWSRRSPSISTNDNPPVCLGIDAGSKTLKLVALDEQGEIVFAMYHRHRSDVMTTLAELAHDAIWRYGDMTLPMAMTGSAGIALGRALGIPFVQEVVATTNAVRRRYPDADCIIELGGEDAKITYLTGNVEQRMNATCAGGTGDFIDGIASMLGIRTRDISKLALGSQRTYPIASRCAVFAQTDVRPLINAGARKADIAQSALEAVVRQTLGGLACGRPISGKVVFLGGPLEHIPALVIAFRRKLGLNWNTGIKPADAHLFAAMGAIMTAQNPPALALSDIEQRALAAEGVEDDAGHLPPLFESEREIEEFASRHAGNSLGRRRLSDVTGPLYLGFDAGSTTMKYALVDETGALVVSDYRNVEGDTFKTAQEMLGELLSGIEGGAYSAKRHHIARAVVTGYGEDLLQAGLGFDEGVVETVAHLRAAQQFRPDASFVLDIGGQDMKALWLQDGQVVDAVLNEACSSGCGAFVQSSTKSLLLQPNEFSQLASRAQNPIDLGAKCTVFMTSRVRHAQKAGASKGDIAAGIAYSVVNNVMTRIIGKNHVAPLGNAVVVQGGTFKSDAVLRAFEKVAEVQAVRPDCAHLMGAYGAALLALDKGDATSGLVDASELSRLETTRTSARCPGCTNNCLVTIVDFGSARRFISGNRCERAREALFGEQPEPNSTAPNVMALEQKLIASYGDIEQEGARGATTIGLPGVLNAYESTPFWHTLFSELGFSIVVPNEAGTARAADRAAETIPSESVCHPAKIAHARYLYLVQAGADYVFVPRFERGTRCPVATGYADALADNVGSQRLASPTMKAIRPRSIVKRPEDRLALADCIRRMAPDNPPEDDEIDAALETALAEQDHFERALAHAAEKAFNWTHADKTRRLAVLAGRPYHVDPALVHRIDAELARIGFAVVPMAAIDTVALACVSTHGAPRGSDAGKALLKGLWKPSKHLMNLVALASGDPQVEVVVLRSFGCGYDAVSVDEARDLATELKRPFTELKIDDIANTAHIRIRLRTLAHTCGLGTPTSVHATVKRPPHLDDYRPPRGGNPTRSTSAAPTPDLCSTAKALVGRVLDEVEASPGAPQVEVPHVCLDCLTDALPFEIKHLCSPVPRIEPMPWPREDASDQQASSTTRPKVGLLGNPLLVFDPALNDGIAALVEQLGWQPVFPAPELVEVEDVRYIDQLERFQSQGVERVIYLQSFGCLKGHVQSRGALHELAARFPKMPITIIDYDPESSALNRENRIRLALS